MKEKRIINEPKKPKAIAIDSDLHMGHFMVALIAAATFLTIVLSVIHLVFKLL